MYSPYGAVLYLFNHHFFATDIKPLRGSFVYAITIFCYRYKAPTGQFRIYSITIFLLPI